MSSPCPATRTAGLLLGLAAAAAVLATGCRRNESEPHAAEITRHAEETSELLLDQAARLARGPDAPRSRETIRDLRQGANEIAERSTLQSAEIRGHFTPRGGGPVVTDATRQAIADARCQVEATCGFVGTGRTYASPSACASVYRNDSFLGWQANTCSQHGFDADRLDRCLSSIRAQSCTALNDPVQLAACRPNLVCPQN